MPNTNNPYYIRNSVFQGFFFQISAQLAYLKSKKKAKDSYFKAKMLIISMRKQWYGSSKFRGRKQQKQDKNQNCPASFFATLLRIYDRPDDKNNHQLLKTGQLHWNHLRLDIGDLCWGRRNHELDLWVTVVNGQVSALHVRKN